MRPYNRWLMLHRLFIGARSIKIEGFWGSPNAVSRGATSPLTVVQDFGAQRARRPRAARTSSRRNRDASLCVRHNHGTGLAHGPRTIVHLVYERLKLAALAVPDEGIP